MYESNKLSFNIYIYKYIYKCVFVFAYKYGVRKRCHCIRLNQKEVIIILDYSVVTVMHVPDVVDRIHIIIFNNRQGASQYKHAILSV